MECKTFALPSGMEVQMYLNPDNTVGALICNNSAKEQDFVFATTKHTVKYKVPARSIASILWQEK
jgi:hypothetical protein